MRVLVSGSSGLIGSALVRVLRDEGADVLRLVRRPVAAPDEVSWDPVAGRTPDLDAVDGLDAVVHLAGAGVGDRRWTPQYRNEILASRVDSTTLLAMAIAAVERKPRVFLSGSAVGFYGASGDAELDEDSPSGDDFLADVCRKWEAATKPAVAAGVRTVVLRSGIVLSTRGGALGKVLPLFRAGLGARLGSGHQYVSWIARPDHVAAVRFLIDAEGVRGPVNLTAPNPVTNATYTKAIGRAVHRPAWLISPEPALKVALGGFAETIVTGQRVLPRRLLDAGFSFDYPALDVALPALLAADA